MALCRGQPRIEPGIDVVDRQIERRQQHKSSFVYGVRGAVTIDEISARHRRDGVSEPIANGYQLVKQASFVARWHGFLGPDRVRSRTSRIAAYVPLSKAIWRTALRPSRKGPPGGEPFLNLHEVV